MPIVNVKVIEGVFTPAQKQEMIKKLTDTMVSIEGENMRGVTWVYIEDVKQGEFIIAFVIFVVIRAIRRSEDKEDKKEDETPKPSEEVLLLREIRDNLKR